LRSKRRAAGKYCRDTLHIYSLAYCEVEVVGVAADEFIAVVSDWSAGSSSSRDVGEIWSSWETPSFEAFPVEVEGADAEPSGNGNGEASFGGSSKGFMSGCWL
jgi:hypothetical protein